MQKMAILLILILSFSTATLSKTTQTFRGLEIVSDLLPENCFNDRSNYVFEILPHCNKTDKFEQPCNQWFNEKNTKNLVYQPTDCAKDGTFAPKQCKGERPTGRCFCFNQEGKRIFGQQWYMQADNMTCACSRRKADMSSDSSIYFNSLHCNSIGNYESLQCDVISEQCWCVDEQTGNLISPVVPQSAMTKLPCYDSLNIGSKYLRQCESKKFAQKQIEYVLKLRGTIASFGDLLCDEDGSFGAYSIIDGLLYCTWRDNSKIGSWQTDAKDSDNVNCNCARDKKIFSNAGKQQLQKCLPTGNYQQYQKSGGEAYCVDNDGYRKSTAAVTTEDECEHYYSYND